MQHPSSLLPVTLVDQVRLWQMERERVQCATVVLYSQFDTQTDFQVLRDYAHVSLLSLSLSTVHPSLLS